MQIALIAVLVVLPIRVFIAQPFIVSGSSMTPTFENGDYLIIDQVSKRFEDPKRQQVAVFRYPRNPSKFFIKRIIGLPGETVVLRGSNVYIKNDTHPEGFKLDEPYVSKHASEQMEVTLDNEQYFVMGDNRNASSDSRSWGPLPENYIIGSPFVRLLPITHAAITPGSIE